MATIQAAYDGRDASWWGLSDADRERYNEWARNEGVPLDGRAVYRTEIHGPEQPFLRVFQYALDEQGRKYLDTATGDTAKQEPHEHPISSMPPVQPASRHPIVLTKEIVEQEPDPDGWARFTTGPDAAAVCPCGLTIEGPAEHVKALIETHRTA